MKKNRLWLLFYGLFILSLVGVCGIGQASDKKDMLVVGIPELPPSVDQDSASHAMASWLMVGNWDTLTGFARKKSTETQGVRVLDYDNYEMRLAERFEISPDSKKITFSLKKGVKSPWGNELTTEDVWWKWDRGYTGLKSSGAFFFMVMDIPSMEALEIIDKYTFSFSANRPNAILPVHSALCCCGYWDSKQAKKHAPTDDKWALDYIGHYQPAFGPYYITEYTPGQQAVFSVNPNYYGSQPAIKKIIFKVIPESSSRVAMIKDGTIDVALELSPREIASLKNVPDVKVVIEKGTWLTFLVLNDLVVKPFGNKLVRQAINYAIDRDKIVDMAFYGLAEPQACVFPSQYPGALDTGEWPYHYDLDKAKQLLKQAGYPDGFMVDLYYPSGNPARETACIVIAEDLRKIGIDVKLRKTPIGSLATLIMSGKVPFAIWQDSALAPDPNYALALYYSTGPAKGGGGFCNYTGFSEAALDDMIKRGSAIVGKARNDHHYDVQRMVIDLSPRGWVVQEDYAVAIRNNIEGWNIDVGQTCRWEELSFRK